MGDRIFIELDSSIHSVNIMIPNSHKIISLGDVSQLSESPLEESLVLCYGHFNVIHPGHIRFLQYAKSLGKN